MADKTLETKSINSLEVFSVGSFNGDDYSESDLDAMISAFNEVGFQPTVKAGHADGQEQEAAARQVFGSPALGYVSRIYREGKKLLADVVDIPKRFADLVAAGAYKRISSEVYWNYDYEGKKFPRVLKSIAFLGADIPAITSLKEIEALYKRNESGALYAYDENKNEYRVYCGESLAMPYTWTKKDKVAANYKNAGDGAEKCATCKFFMGGSCNLVEGDINPGDYCDLYEPRNYKMDENKVRSIFAELLDKATDKWTAMFEKLPKETPKDEIKPKDKDDDKEQKIMDEKQLQAEREATETKVRAEYEAKLEAQKRDYESKLATEKDAALSASEKEKTELRERLAKLEQAKEDAEVDAFITEQKREGKMLPVEEQKFSQLLKAVKGMPKVVKYSEGDKTIEETPEEALKSFITSRKAHNLFKEFSKDGNEPRTYSGERADMEVDRKAKAYMNDKGEKNYKSAVSAVLKADAELSDRYDAISRAN